MTKTNDSVWTWYKAERASHNVLKSKQELQSLNALKEIKLSDRSRDKHQTCRAFSFKFQDFRSIPAENAGGPHEEKYKVKDPEKYGEYQGSCFDYSPCTSRWTNTASYPAIGPQLTHLGSPLTSIQTASPQLF